MKARIKFHVAKVGIDAFREEVEEELRGDWAQRSFDPTSLLFIEDESIDAPPVNSVYGNGTSSSEFEHWVETNVVDQKQTGYKAVNVKLYQGDIQADQFHKLADMARKYAGGRARITHQQNLTFRWVPEGALHSVWEELNEIGFGQSGIHEISDVVSCPGTDSCKLGITSSMGLGPGCYGQDRRDEHRRPVDAQDARQDERMPERMRTASRRGHRLPWGGVEGAGRTGAGVRAVPGWELR